MAMTQYDIERLRRENANYVEHDWTAFYDYEYAQQPVKQRSRIQEIIKLNEFWYEYGTD